MSLAYKPTIKIFQDNPVRHIQEAQGVTTLEPFQKQICEAVRTYQRVSVAACHDVGKTFTMAKIVLWFGSIFPGAKIITTAPTFNQVKRLLWSEIRSGYAKSKFPLGGEMMLTEWKIADDWFAIGFSTKGTDADSGGQGTSSSFQGWHAPYLLVVFDEATGIPGSIWQQLEGILTSSFVRFVAIGNPTSKGSEFYRTFQKAGVHKIYLSCFDSPNLKANHIIDMPSLIAEIDKVKAISDEEEREKYLSQYVVVHGSLLSTRWVIERAIEWGLAHPLFVSKALGQFPDEDDNAIISLGLVEEAIYREPSRHMYPISFGVDVARFGTDKTVITRMDGTNVTEVKKLIKKSTTETSGEVISLVNGCPRALAEGCIIAIDGTGIGAGVVDSLMDYQQHNMSWRNVRVLEVNFGSGFDIKSEGTQYQAEEKKKKYVNKKAEVFVVLAADLKTDISLPNDNDYLKELPTIVYRFDAKGRQYIESKEEFKKRTGLSSPDTSDSLALANYARRQPNFSEVLPESRKIDIPTIAGSLNSRRDNW